MNYITNRNRSIRIGRIVEITAWVLVVLVIIGSIIYGLNLQEQIYLEGQV